jgi:hypothetical protein
MWKLDDENKSTNDIADEARYHLTACLRYIGSDSEFKPETVNKVKTISKHSSFRFN